MSLYTSEGMVVKYLSLISGFRGCHRSIAFEPKRILSSVWVYGGSEGQVQKRNEFFNLWPNIHEDILEFYLIKVIAVFSILFNGKKWIDPVLFVDF